MAPAALITERSAFIFTSDQEEEGPSLASPLGWPLLSPPDMHINTSVPVRPCSCLSLPLAKVPSSRRYLFRRPIDPLVRLYGQRFFPRSGKNNRVISRLSTATDDSRGPLFPQASDFYRKNDAMN